MLKRFLLSLVVVACLFGNAMAATQFDFLLSQVRTVAQGALIGGSITFYEPGSTTLKAIYLDRTQSTLALNPYTLDSNGTAQLYGAGNYRIVIKDSSGVTRYDRDNIGASGDDGSVTLVDATSANQTYSLPTSGSVVVIKTDATAHTVTIQPSVGGQTINRLASYVLYLDQESVRLTFSGSDWYKN